MNAHGVPTAVERAKPLDPEATPPGQDRRSMRLVPVPLAAAVDSQTLAQRVADRLRNAILQGELQAGQPLRQAELASRFGVSPIPFREALRQLQVEGFVTLHPYRGALVATLSAAELRDLADIFLALQGLALRLAVSRMDARTLHRARAVLRAMKATDDPERWGALAGEFQLTLAAAASGRPHLLGAIRSLLVNIGRYRLLGVTRPEYRRRSEQRAAEILGACEKGDGRGAVSILQDHVATVSAEIASRLARPSAG